MEFKLIQLLITSIALFECAVLAKRVNKLSDATEEQDSLGTIRHQNPILRNMRKPTPIPRTTSLPLKAYFDKFKQDDQDVIDWDSITNAQLLKELWEQENEEETYEFDLTDLNRIREFRATAENLLQLFFGSKLVVVCGGSQDTMLYLSSFLVDTYINNVSNHIYWIDASSDSYMIRDIMILAQQVNITKEYKFATDLLLDVIKSYGSEPSLYVLVDASVDNYLVRYLANVLPIKNVSVVATSRDCNWEMLFCETFQLNGFNIVYQPRVSFRTTENLDTNKF